jgi:hypothetical protein
MNGLNGLDGGHRVGRQFRDDQLGVIGQALLPPFPQHVAGMQPSAWYGARQGSQCEITLQRPVTSHGRFLTLAGRNQHRSVAPANRPSIGEHVASTGTDPASVGGRQVAARDVVDVEIRPSPLRTLLVTCSQPRV